MFERLTREELDKLHAASLEVMARSGVRMMDQEALAVLAKGGCTVDGSLVKFPAKLVAWALDACPKSLTLYNQRLEPAIQLSGRVAYYGNGSDLLYIIDHRTNQRRDPKLQDVRDMMAVLDALANVDFVMSGFIPKDVPWEKAQRCQMLAMLEETAKPIIYVTTDLANTQACVAMAEIAAGGQSELRDHPFAANYINISNPLRHNPESIWKLMWLSARNLPFIYRPSIVTRGISTPITWAGFLVVNNVAALAGIVLSQLVREGAPFIRCGCAGGTFDMHTMVGQHAAPEIRGHNEDLAEYYRLPRFGIGGLSGSKDVDQQAAAEAALTLLASTQAGAQLIHDLGYMDNGTTTALDQVVICHEIIGWVKQYMRKLEVNEETIALELIDEVVKANGDFLQAEHTASNCRMDYYPELFDRGNYDSWVAGGGRSLRDKAKAKVDELLRRHKTKALSASVAQQLRKIIDA